MTCAEMRAQLNSLLEQQSILTDRVEDPEFQKFNKQILEQMQLELQQINLQIPALVNELVAQGCFVKRPQRILEIQHTNPEPPSDFGNSGAATIAGGEFPSWDVPQEWKQVLAPEEDYDLTLVGATGWALDPKFSGADVPFTHPFGFDWEFFLALDQPSDNPTKYTPLLARGNQVPAEDGQLPISQARELKDSHGPIPVPQGFDLKPSLLGVEIEKGLVPNHFSDPNFGVAPGDRMAVFGRWIVDCGHKVPSGDVQTFRSEIHPPLLMAWATVTTASIATGSPTGPEFTRVLFTSRPYLVSRGFTTDTHNDPAQIYNDAAPDDGPFYRHLVKEVVKANTIVLSSMVEAHPKIKSFPFQGAQLAHFVVRTPTPSGGIGQTALSDRLFVSFQFTVRSGCAVQVISSGPDTIDVFIVLNQAGYTPPPLPNINNHTWSRDELNALNPGAGPGYLKAEELSAAAQLVVGGPIAGAITAAVVEHTLGKGIKTDEYDTDAMRSVNILDASHAISTLADDIPSTDIPAQLASLLKDREDLSSEVVSDEGDLKELQSESSHVNQTLLAKAKAKLVADEAKLKQIDDQIAALNAVVRGVVHDDNQPYPVYGWLEVTHVPPTKHP